VKKTLGPLAAAETGEIYQYRDVFELAAGLQHWDTCIVPLWENGRIVRLLGSSRDITRQILAEEELRQSQKLEAIGSLTGGVAHDFNNLLTPILGALDMVQRKGVGGAREQRLIEGALASAERGKSLVHRLLAFARRQPLRIEAASIPGLLVDMVELVTSTVGPKVKVETDVAPAVPLAKADTNQLEMALLNLSVNARDAMPNGGYLHIEAAAEHIGSDHESSLAPGSYVRITVADTGEGMDEQTQRRAIEPFFSTKGIGKGTSLGLSMVHGLAAQPGGALTIRGEVGVGTRISLWVPTSDDLGSAARQLEQAPLCSAFVGSALLVDDDELARKATATMLSELGFSVTQASCAEQALGLMQEGVRVDLLVTDHLMPGMNGADLCMKVLRRVPGMQVLVISSFAETNAIPPSLPMLMKPFQSADLSTIDASGCRPGCAAPLTHSTKPLRSSDADREVARLSRGLAD